MIKVLQVITSLEGGGGVQMLLRNYHKYINKDKIIFDFIVYGDEIGELESYFKSYGSKIYHIPPKTKSLIKSLSQMRKIIKSGNYDVVHAHQDIMSIFPIYFAKKAKINLRIAHAHSAFKSNNKIKKLIHKVLLVLLEKYSNYWAACGKEAAMDLWGKENISLGNINIINNAIDVNNFKFNNDIRKEIRKELGVENKFVIGNIGRFIDVKNHKFIIEVFKHVSDMDKEAILLLVGKGELESEVRNQVKKLGLEQNVKFLGLRNDIDKILQGIDVFLLPSKFEGVPIALIEAQASDLTCLVSDVVTKEVKITDKVEYMSLDKDAKAWAEKILSYKCNKRYDTSKLIKKVGFDISEQAKSLENLYKSHRSYR